MKKIRDGEGTVISDRAFWCRKADCKNHPTNRAPFEGIKVCYLCKHFVPKDMYEPFSGTRD